MATITCPHCKHKQEIHPPKHGVLPFYMCKGCKNIIPTPKDSHCVLCAYSDHKCE